jgi:hypothetical protein
MAAVELRSTVQAEARTHMVFGKPGLIRRDCDGAQSLPAELRCRRQHYWYAKVSGISELEFAAARRRVASQLRGEVEA